ncbi:vWA domain-containing protein [Bradymonas sediminis]|uniref:Uncharacterized protein n=1 Tax=Bradymonas sediminis TaxID=1548548 RepID=A0A2Z4FLZ7_9DELT|nr:VWA domain-containing protein [Bradymonas sediminis]AWV89698.1 hypothetical protein DN745_10240 [Bradymonas sediminis]TDP76561.1 Ca-activated chloride channel family protein [Bradymonas sediminis]
MKRFGTVAVIAALLLATALFYRFRGEEATPDTRTPTPPVTERPTAPPTPTMHATKAGVLTLSADSSHGYMLSDSAQEVYAAIDIAAQQIDGGERPPLNISLVIDRSGSMRGSKMENAKSAAIALIDKLRPQDRISIVSYATDVEVTMPSTMARGTDIGAMQRQIRDMRAAGGTNIAGGYTYGVEEVKKFMRDDTINRVILVSDGEATIGNTNPDVFRKMAQTYRAQGVSLSTIGVGLDYNEDLMAGMADEGAGNYYFVDAPSSAVAIFERELDSLAKTVAKNTAVLLSFGDGVILEDVYGFAHQNVGSKVAISLAEFQSGENKNILLKLRVDPSKGGVFPLMNATLSYKDMQQSDLNTQIVALESVRTEDVELAKSKVNVEVIGRVQQIEVAESLKDAMTAYEAGRDEEAKEVLRKSQRRVQAASDKYQFKSEAVGRAGGELKDALDAVNKPAATFEERERTVKYKKSKSRNMKRSDSIDLW